MFKKMKWILLVVLLLNIMPTNAFAAGGSQSNQYYPPSDSDFYQKRISWQIFTSFGTKKMRMTQYAVGMPQDPANVIGVITWNVKENDFVWVDQTCAGSLSFEFIDGNDQVIDFLTRGETTSYLNSGSCSGSSFVAPSKYIEAENRYSDDTFAATQPKANPIISDGSGGKTTTAYDSVDPTNADGTNPANGTGTGGTGTGGTTTTCDACAVFDCPGWADHMNGLTNIANKIPPAPNWQEVANTFRDTIAPQVKSDLQQILGSVDDPPSAPSAPGAPSLGSNLDDGGLTAPTGSNAPGLDGSTFSENDIKSGAPVINERQDGSGGFTINNPLNGLPTQDEFIQNAPNEGTADLPGNPTELDNQSPTPSEGTNTAPTPDDPGGTAPTPTDPGGTAPLPNDTGTAPLPNETGTAPLPNESGTAPLPGG